MARRSRRKTKDNTQPESDTQNEEDEATQQDPSVMLTKGEEPRLFQDSGLTDRERRNIRTKQRNLLKELAESDDVNIDEFRETNNILFDKVRYTREAVLDGENLDVIAKKTSRQVDSLIKVPRYDAERLSSKLVSKFRENGGFSWSSFGHEAGICLNTVPTDVSFLNGPLMDGYERPARERKKSVRAKVEEEHAVEQRPQTVDQRTTVRDADQLSAIESSMKVLNKLLKRKVNDGYKAKKRMITEVTGESKLPADLDKKLKKYGVGVDAIQYLFNPNSFTQTVENIFHFSFLIKKGNAVIGIRDRKKVTAKTKDGEEKEVELWKGGPFVRYSTEDQDDHPTKQAIVALTMRDWRALCKVYGVKKGDLPHRTGSKFTAAPGPSPKRRRTSST